MDISGAIEEYLAVKQNSITTSTYEWYATFLSLFADWCTQHQLIDLSALTPPHIQQFVAASPTPNTHTRHARAQVIKGFLAWCAEDPDMGIKERTVKRIQMPKMEQSDVSIFSDEEIFRLFRACEKTKHPHRNRAILHILLDTGIRAAELAFDSTRPEEETGLRLENIIFSRAGDSFVRVMGKGRKVRTVGIGQETQLAIRKYLNRERTRSESPYVFLGQNRDPFSVRMLQQLLHRLGELADVSDCHTHRFRHTFAVSQLMNGTSSLVLMQLMGHTTLEATKIYTRAISHVQARKAASSVVDRMKRKQRRHTL